VVAGRIEIGDKDFQGADLSRRLLHGSVRNGTQDRLVLIGTTVLKDHSQPPLGFWVLRRIAGNGLV